MTTYAITGATGHLGRLLVQELLARGVPATDVVALARTPEKAAEVSGGAGDGVSGHGFRVSRGGNVWH